MSSSVRPKRGKLRSRCYTSEFPSSCGHLVADVLHEASAGQVDLSGLWVAWDRSWKFVPERSIGLCRGRGRVIGAFLTQALAGRAAASRAPEVVPSFDERPRRPDWYAQP